MTGKENPGGTAGPIATDTEEEKSDLKVVLQFFIVPLALVGVLVTVFFGLQVLRSRHPDPRTTLRDLKEPGTFLLPWVGDPKRWQSGYDLSLLVRSADDGGVPVPEMAEALRETRGTGDLKLRRYLALALGRSADPRARDVLREGAADPDGETRLYCVWGLMQIGGPESVVPLRGAVLDPDAGVRKMAVFALGSLGDRGAASILRGALADPDTDVRSNAALSLARIGDASGEPILVGILDAWVSNGASEGRARREADEVSPALNAVRGLALLRDAGARAVLGRAARSGRSDRVRDTARLALETIDAEARGALP